MRKSIKLLIVGVSLALLSGCASVGPQPTGNEEATYHTSYGVSDDHKLFENVSVETYEFLETTKNHLSAKSTANLNNENAKKVIEASLDKANLLASEKGDYTLTAYLTDADLAEVLFGTNRSWKRHISINYLLTDMNGNKIYNKEITGYAKRKMRGFHIVWTQQKIASEIAYKDNFRQLIEDLKQLK